MNGKIKMKKEWQDPKIDRYSFLLLAIGTLLMAFANGRWIVPIATWLAPVFLLRFSRI